MNQEFVTYLETIGMTKTLIERVEFIYERIRKLCSEDITDLFVNEYITENGSREYDSIHFFSPNYIMEAKQFTNTETFDIAPLRIGYIDFSLQDYDFTQAIEKSRVVVNVYFINTFIMAQGFALRGSRENCDYLVKIFEKYIKRNLVT